MGAMHLMKHGILPVVLAFFTLSLVINVWISSVSEHVTKPYLDEIFHVGQAQTYCDGRFYDWDSKITTPPGLYILSYLVYQVTGYCNLLALRSLNGALLFCIFIVVLCMSYPSSSKEASPRRFISGASTFPAIVNAHPQQIHTALNLCLFPPLFFFGGLYYTDVGSTLFVLLFFKHFLDIHSNGLPSVSQSLTSVLLGLLALTFRQTNIFWVAVFPAGFVLLGGISERRDQSRDILRRSQNFQSQVLSIVEKSWQEGVLYDPQVQGAWVEDYLFNVVSIVALTLRTLTMPYKILRLVRLVLPYAVLLTLFGGFVLWNGGVVLGDKSNHIATLHLPQMLYIWPYITFFSITLTYPIIIQGALALLATIPAAMVFEPLLIFRRYRFLPRPLTVLLFITTATCVVKFNTIVHPFTLADNRHYPFYVFRILMRHPAIKFMVTPVYFLCSWSVVQALGKATRFFSSDAVSSRTVKKSKSSKEATTSQASAPIVCLNDASIGEGSEVSFVLIWLITSTLALVTAPLVEPRYFIIPWIMWRLRVAHAYPYASDPHPHQVSSANSKKESTLLIRMGNATTRLLWTGHDHRLWLETAWFLVINAVTSWVFLNKGFTWPQEPGNVQRFMW